MTRRVLWITASVIGLIYLSIHTSTTSGSSGSETQSTSFRSHPRPAAALIASHRNQQNAEVPLADSSNWPWDPHARDPLLEFCPYNSRTALTLLPDGTGSVRGIRCVHSELDAFLGIPYAKPPVGAGRFAAPALLDQAKERIWEAKRFSKMCSQPARPPHRPRWALSEDCLTVNVFRPTPPSSMIDPSQAKLPVMVWIYGGGLETGDTLYNNATYMIEHSVEKGTPVLIVSFNYRLGPMGFLASSDLEDLASNGETALNAGLHDMQAALLWVQRNIETFGGDRDKVTVYGQSAGAIGISSLLLADDGKAVGKLNLFRAAILQSGAPMADSTRLPNATDPEYSVLLQSSRCLFHPTPRTRLACLRTKSEGELARAVTAVWQQTHWRRPYDRVQDGYFHSGTPSEAVRAGRVGVVPILAGSVLDEGTFFAPRNIESKEDIIEYFKHWIAGSRFTSFLPTLDTLLELYPDAPSLGSPYEPYHVSPHDRFLGSTNMYKRMASIFGDVVFESGRRALMRALVKKEPTNPIYAYQFVVQSSGRDPSIGVPHGAELPFAQGNVAAEYPGTDEARISNGMMNACLNFVYYLDPNGDDVPYWPTYAHDPRGLILRVNKGNTEIVMDDYRAEGIAFLGSPEWTRWFDL